MNLEASDSETTEEDEELEIVDVPTIPHDIPHEIPHEKLKAAYFFITEEGDVFGVCDETGTTEAFEEPQTRKEEENQKEECVCDDCIIEFSSEEEWICGDCGCVLQPHSEDEDVMYCGKCGSFWVYDIEGDDAYYIVTRGYDQQDGVVPMDISAEEEDLPSLDSEQVEDDDDDDEGDDVSTLASEQDEEISSENEGFEEQEDEDWEDSSENVEDTAEAFERRIEKLLNEMWEDANRNANDAVDCCNRVHEKVEETVQSGLENFPTEFAFDQYDDRDELDIELPPVEPNPFDVTEWKFPPVDESPSWLRSRTKTPEEDWGSEEHFQWPAEEDFKWQFECEDFDIPPPPVDGFKWTDYCHFPAEDFDIAPPFAPPVPVAPTTDQIDWPPTSSIFDDLVNPRDLSRLSACCQKLRCLSKSVHPNYRKSLALYQACKVKKDTGS